MAESQKVNYIFGAVNNAKKEFAQLNKDLKSNKKETESFTQSVKSAAPALIAMGVAIGAVTIAAIKFASDLEELRSKAKVLFGENAQDVEEWAGRVGKEVGRARSSVLLYATDMKAVVEPTGLATEAADTMSKNMAKLAIDMASFHNTADIEAFHALRSAVTGETEPMKRFGVVMTEANLAAFALSEGIETNIKDMGQAQKAALRYNYIMEQTSVLQGDAERTAEGVANQTRRFQEQVKTLFETLGSPMLENTSEAMIKLNGVMEDLIEVIDDNREAIKAFGEAAIGSFAFVIEHVGRAIQGFTELYGIIQDTIASMILLDTYSPFGTRKAAGGGFSGGGGGAWGGSPISASAGKDTTFLLKGIETTHKKMAESIKKDAEQIKLDLGKISTGAGKISKSSGGAAKATKDAETEIKKSYENIRESVKDSIEEIQEIQSNYRDSVKETKEEVKRLNEEFERNKKTIVDNISSIKKQMSDLTNENKESAKTTDKNLAEQIVKQEELIKSLEDTIEKKRQNFEMAKEEKQQLKEEKAVLEKYAEERKRLENEVSDIRRFNSLTAFEQSIETIKNAAEKRDGDFQKEKEQLQKELEEKQTQLQQMEEEHQKHLDVLEEQRARDLVKFKSYLDLRRAAWQRHINELIIDAQKLGGSETSNVTNNSVNFGNVSVSSNQDIKNLANEVGKVLSRDFDLSRNRVATR